jgi:LytS/YehU family sensor histidine kinase
LWAGVSALGLGLTHALRAVVHWRGWLALPPAALLSRMGAGTVVLTAACGIATALLSEAIYGSPVAPLYAAFYERLSPGGQLRNQSIAMLVVILAWVAIYLAVAMQRRRYQAELREARMGAALQSAELRLLKSQLNPHFLFNALNGVRALIADEPARARDAVTQLARMLRHTLAAGDEDLVSLRVEMELVDDYLALESMRLAERLRVERDVDDAALGARIPAMLLQTLVENAIKHGIAELQQGGALRISARVIDGELRVEVRNPAPIPGGNANGGGVGIRNARERLRLLFGHRASLQLDLSQPGQARAELRLPA